MMAKNEKPKAEIFYLDDDDNPCPKEQATRARIVEKFSDGRRRETYAFIEKPAEV